MDRLLKLPKLSHEAFELLSVLIVAAGYRCHHARNQSSKHPGCTKRAHEVKVFVKPGSEPFALGRCLSCNLLEKWG